MSKEMEALTGAFGMLVAEHKALAAEHKKTQDRLAAKEKEKKAKDTSGDVSSLKERRHSFNFLSFCWRLPCSMQCTTNKRGAKL